MNSINDAIALRANSRPVEALTLLLQLLKADPKNPDIEYQIAWTYDSMGEESKAVAHYENALAHGLIQDREGAMLGLGSTYRCLGEYEKSVMLLSRAVKEFPENRALKTFLALSLYNAGNGKQAVSELLLLLIDTTSDEHIKSYESALRFYSDKLDETWK